MIVNDEVINGTGTLIQEEFEYNYDSNIESEYSIDDNISGIFEELDDGFNDIRNVIDSIPGMFSSECSRSDVEHIIKIVFDCKEIEINGEEVDEGVRILRCVRAYEDVLTKVERDIVGYYYEETLGKWLIDMEMREDMKRNKRDVMVWINEEIMNKKEEYNKYIDSMFIKYGQLERVDR